MLKFIFGYYVFTFQQYVLHYIQHIHIHHPLLPSNSIKYITSIRPVRPIINRVINYVKNGLIKHKAHGHHRTYDRNNITNIIYNNSLIDNLDLYFYGNIGIGIINFYIFDTSVFVLQMSVAYLSFYFHNEYHNPNNDLIPLFTLQQRIYPVYKSKQMAIDILRKGYWKHYKFFQYLKRKHIIHHKNTSKNHFLLDPTFDLIFGSYQ